MVSGTRRGGRRRLDAVAYSFDPGLAPPRREARRLRPVGPPARTYAERAGAFLATRCPGWTERAALCAPPRSACGLGRTRRAVCRRMRGARPGRARRTAQPPGRARVDSRLRPLYSQQLPQSLGLVYEEATEHLGFLRSSDEYKVMALASYGQPRHLDALRPFVHATGDGGFVASGIDWNAFTKPRGVRRAVDRRARRSCGQPAGTGRGDDPRAGAVAARADRRAGAGHGRRRGTELRRQLAGLRRDAVRARLGAACGRRRGNRTRWRTGRRCRLRRRADRHDERRARPRGDRGRDRGCPAHGAGALRAAGRPRRDRGRRAGPRRHRRVVAGPQ